MNKEKGEKILKYVSMFKKWMRKECSIERLMETVRVQPAEDTRG